MQERHCKPLEAAGSPPATSKHINNQEEYNGKQFKRIRVLGKGSFGIASVNRRRADHSLVVLKEIDLARFKGEGERESGIQEARIMSNLNHPNIIKYYNAYTSETKLIIEMEYASIGTLAAFLSFQMEPLEELEVLIIFRQITSGLSYLHSRNIIHLDLKMTNIFVTIEGFIKIGDFGIAQYLNNSNNNNNNAQVGGEKPQAGRKQFALHNSNPNKIASSQLGTLAYSSPERCIGCETSFKSDIWSLGCILYELITSRPLFCAESLSELLISITRVQYTPIKRNLTSGLKETFEQMIAREPSERPSADSLLMIIDQLSQKIHQQKHQKSLQSTRTSQQQQQQLQQKRRQHRFDLSTDLGGHLAAGQQATGNNNENIDNPVSGQLNYPHSFVYQVCLGASNIRLDRVNLPATKRVKEMAKGQSHYLVLTYDNIVYGWGTKSHGQLGSCGLSSSGSAASVSGRPVGIAGRSAQRGTRSARSSLNARDVHLFEQQLSSTQAPSLASSTQTIIGGNIPAGSAGVFANSKQLIMNSLAESKPATRPFVINELNNRKIIQVAAGNNFSVFLSKTGIVMTCGDGSSGCLGRGDLKSAFTPCMVESLLNTDVVSIASGPEHVVAVCGNGRAFAWGKNRHGRLGIAASGLQRSSKFVARPQQVQFDELLESSSTKINSNPASGNSDDERQEVGIKSVFCGDRSSVFIDSLGRCWACGDNKFNKLGLDTKRRFKRTLVVELSRFPVQIRALSKYKIITCNIGKNHSTFLTNEGKLIVFGQDIDHTYRLRENIISGPASQRRISHELQPFKVVDGKRKLGSEDEINLSTISCKSANFRPLKSYRQLTRLLIAHNQLSSFKQSSDSLATFGQTANNPSCEQFARCKLNRKQRQQMELFVRKSRSMKKMPFDCVISVSCRPKFSLALSNDNRVYFWGTRSYRKCEDELHFMKLLAGCCTSELLFPLEPSVLGQQKSVEPQLVANCSDECFVKIGATNSSLMSSIQLLGSDQPIIHAQDPQLRAQSLADLWILDYRPEVSSSSSSSSSPCSSRSSSGCSYSCSLSSCSSAGSSCLECRQEPARVFDFEPADFLKHDAILEPQPIVSLYVPSMFNHNGSSLNLVDLFCFDEDRFYLVLDTTVKLAPQQIQTTTSHAARSPTTTTATANKSRARVNSFAGSAPAPRTLGAAPAVANNGQQQAAASRQKAANLAPLERQVECEDEPAGSGASKTNGSLANCREPVELQVDQAKTFDSSLQMQNHDGQNGQTTSGGAKQAPLMARNCISSDDNNNISSGSELKTSQGPEEGLQCSSHCGASIEEPRSLSTFAASQVILSPSMRRVEPLKALNFEPSDQLALSQPEASEATMLASIDGEGHLGQELAGSELESAGDGWQAGLKVDCGEKVRRRRRRNRLSANKSESTTFTCNELDNETSSMPSWVRNEFIQQQELGSSSRQRAAEALFQLDSSATEDTYVSELSLTGSEQTLASAGSSGPAAESDNDVQSVIEKLTQTEVDSNIRTSPEPTRGSETRPGLFSSRSEVDVRKYLLAGSGAGNRKGSVACCDNSFDGARNILDCSVYKTTAEVLERPLGHSSQELHNNYLSTLSSRCNSNNPLIEASPLVGAKWRQNGDISTRPAVESDNRLAQQAASESLEWSTSHLRDARAGDRSSFPVAGNRHSSQSTTTNTTVIDPTKRGAPALARTQPISKSEVHLFRDCRPRQPDRVSTKQAAGGSSASLSALRNSFLGRLFC